MNTRSKDLPVFYDCEASGLEGFPIEIGWAFFDETAGTIRSEGHLIRPASAWNIQANWDLEAEKLHGITPADLAARGRPPFEIAQRMNAAFADRNLYSDSLLDEVWLRMLFEESNADPAFTIWRTDARVIIARAWQARGQCDDKWAAAQKTADRLAPCTHRAADDARNLAMRWLIASGRSPDWTD
jgi:hypothetical protein